MPKSLDEQYILASTVQLNQEIFKNLSQSKTQRDRENQQQQYEAK